MKTLLKWIHAMYMFYEKGVVIVIEILNYKIILEFCPILGFLCVDAITFWEGKIYDSRDIKLIIEFTNNKVNVFSLWGSQ